MILLTVSILNLEPVFQDLRPRNELRSWQASHGSPTSKLPTLGSSRLDNAKHYNLTRQIHSQSSFPGFSDAIIRLLPAFTFLAIAILGLASLFDRFFGNGGPSSGLDMAWRSSGATNAALVANLLENGLITTERVKQAMLGVGTSARSADTTIR